MSQPIDRELSFEVTVNALTAKGTPATTQTRFPSGTVVNVEIVIPAGVAGLAGLRISCSGTQLFPINTGSWLIGDNEVVTRDVYNWPNSGRIDVEAFNEDIHAHTFQVRYAVAENPLPAPVAPVTGTPLPVGSSGEPVQVPSETGGTGEGATPGELSPAPPVEAPGGVPPAPPEETPAAPPPAPEESPAAPPEAPPEAAPEAPGEAAPTEESPEPFPGEGAAMPEDQATAEAGGTYGETGGVRAPGGPKLKRKPASKGPTRKVTVKESLPAGGWLPHGARFTLERQDQGQDFITAWKGPIVAPASGTVLHNLSDKAFPSGFGPSYCVVHIDSGPFGGKDWYIGHCTSAVRAGQKFKAGQVLAHADQGHVQGGGWCELGYAPGGYPGPMSDGAKFASLFRTVVKTTTKKVSAGPPKRKAAKGKTKVKPGAKKPAKRKVSAKGKPKKKAATKRAGGTKAPKVKAPRAKRTPRVKPVKAAKAARVKRVKAAPKAKPVKRAPAAKAKAAPRKRKR